MTVVTETRPGASLVKRLRPQTLRMHQHMAEGHLNNGLKLAEKCRKLE